MQRTILKLRFLFILLILTVGINKLGFTQGVSPGIISYTGTLEIPTDQTAVDHSWDKDFSSEEYFLFVRAWKEEDIDGKTVQIENGIYNFNKAVGGFTLNLKEPGGELSYFAYEAQNTISAPLIQSFIATEGQTNFTLDKTPFEASVWLNGLLQFPGVWSINENDIVLTSATSAGDEIGVSYKEGTSNEGGGETDPTQYTITINTIYENDASAASSGTISPVSKQFSEGTTVSVESHFVNSKPEVDHFKGFTLSSNGIDPTTSLNVTMSQNITVYAVYDYTTQSSSTLLNGIIAAYHLDEISGTLVSDDHGDIDGINSGASVNQAGILGSSYLFENINDDKVLIPDNELFSIGSNGITISLFAKFSSTDSDEGTLLTKGFEYWIYSSTDRRINFRIFGEDLYTQSTGRRTDADAITSGQWYHIVCTYDGGLFRDGLKIYLNGVRSDNDNRDQYRIYGHSNSTMELSLGFDNVNGSNVFDGKLDEVNIWNRALTSDEITELYNNSSGKAYPFNN